VLLQLAELRPAVDSPHPAEDDEDEAFLALQVGEAVGPAVGPGERELRRPVASPGTVTLPEHVT